MSADRNKTQLTQNITRNVALWLDGKGFKPVETEVGVERGWVADVAGVCTPTPTELIELKLIKRRPRWPYKNSGPSDPAVAKYEAENQAWKAALDAIPPLMTALVEVKTSVGDYTGDRKWTAAWPTNLCFVAMPEGMIPAEKWPAGWGVILCSQEGTTIRKVHYPSLRPVTIEQQLRTTLALAVRRDHATRYQRMREMKKRVRITEQERRVEARVGNCIRLVKDVLAGKPIEDALRWNGFRKTLPPYAMQELEKIRPAAPVAPLESLSA